MNDTNVLWLSTYDPMLMQIYTLNNRITYETLICPSISNSYDIYETAHKICENKNFPTTKMNMIEKT